MRNLFLLTLTILVIGVSCSPTIHSRINLSGNYTWENKSLTLNPDVRSFISTGDMILWVKGIKFNATYELFADQPDMYRLDLRGPLNSAIATIILHGEKANVFYEGEWKEAPWPEVSENLLGVYVPLKLLNLMAGGRLEINGQCTAYEKEELCREDGFYFLMAGSIVNEVKSETITVVRTVEENKDCGKDVCDPVIIWTGKNNKQSFSLIPRSTDINPGITPSVFEPTNNKGDLLDEI